MRETIERYRNVCAALGAPVEERQAAEARRKTGGDPGAWVRFGVGVAAREGWNAWTLALARAVWGECGLWWGDQPPILRALGLDGEAEVLEAREAALFGPGLDILRRIGWL